MIKVALIIERANIALGGAERSIVELSEALAELGADVTLLAATGDRDAANIKVLCDGNSSGRTSLAKFGAALEAHFKEKHYDIIHSTLPFAFADIYQPRGGSYAEAIIRNSASYDSAVYSRIKRATHFLNTKRAELFNAEKTICQNDKGPVVAALSEYVAGQFARHYAMDAERIVLIRNGVKIVSDPDDSGKDQLRSEIYRALDITDRQGSCVFLFGANNFRLKGLATILRALQIIKTNHGERKICVAVAGSGKVEKYSALAKKLGVADRIVFLESLKGISNAMAVCDAALLPTYYDPCSRFILEGLAAAKPVITTVFNGAAEFIRDRIHGIILKNPGDSGQLAEAMRFYAEKSNAQNASDAIIADNLKQNISIMRHGRQMIELYEKIMTGGRH
jgi:UDP-glucose:(heptosyl)LPS alpha-1,3-glucosyltransferase